MKVTFKTPQPKSKGIYGKDIPFGLFTCDLRDSCKVYLRGRSTQPNGRDFIVGLTNPEDFIWSWTPGLGDGPWVNDFEMLEMNVE